MTSNPKIMIEHDFYKLKLDHPLVSKRPYGNSSMKWRFVNPFEAVEYLHGNNLINIYFDHFFR